MKSRNQLDARMIDSIAVNQSFEEYKFLICKLSYKYSPSLPEGFTYFTQENSKDYSILHSGILTDDLLEEVEIPYKDLLDDFLSIQNSNGFCPHKLLQFVNKYGLIKHEYTSWRKKTFYEPRYIESVSTIIEVLHDFSNIIANLSTRDYLIGNSPTENNQNKIARSDAIAFTYFNHTNHKPIFTLNLESTPIHQLRQLKFKPLNLLSLLWLLLAGRFSNNNLPRKCSAPNCKKFYTGRSQKLFCSDACRVKANRAKKHKS